MNHMELQYFKTDKNGTKYFYDWKCPRCAGFGSADKWRFTGSICFACGGSGKRNSPKIVKEYTPEYWAKLEAKRIAKEQKRIAEAQKYAEEHADEIAEQNRKELEKRYADFGCGADGIGYVLKGNTFQMKDQIKRAGGRWIYGTWVCPVEMSGKGITSKKIDLAGHIGSGSMMWLDDFDLYDAING